MKATLEETAAWIREHAEEFAAKLIAPSKRQPRIPDEKRRQIAQALAKGGELDSQIMKRFGVSQCMGTLIRKEFSLPIGRKGPWRNTEEMHRRDEKILALDDGTRTLKDIGDKFGITRERVRQIFEANGQPHMELRHKLRASKTEAIQHKRMAKRAQREAERMIPSTKVWHMAHLFRWGKTYREIGEELGLKPESVQVHICGHYRKRWPHLFPYRRAWGGKPAGWIPEQDARPYWKIRTNGNNGHK
jgi:predicted transcriptional regulator